MANNVRVQLEKAIEMKDVTQKFAILVNRRMQDLSDILEHYVRYGFPEDVAQTYYANYITPDQRVLAELSERMKNEHVAFLDDVINELKGIVELQ